MLFYLGGMIYCGIELLWRRRTHGSMFVLGGACFVILGAIGEVGKKLPPILRVFTAAGVITALELATGLLVNRDFVVWDYRQMPLNFRGQICLPYFLAWMPLAAAAMWIYPKLDAFLVRKSAKTSNNPVPFDRSQKKW